MISQAVSNRLKSGLPNTVVRFDPAVGIPLAARLWVPPPWPAARKYHPDQA
jgi:hypothetical protein